METGLLASFANLLGPIAQIFGSRLIEKFHRKKIVVWGVVFQAISCLIFVSLGIIFLLSQKTFYLVPLVILTYIFYHLSVSLSEPAWFSLMGDVVPENIRGKYFSGRNKITSFFSISSALFAASLLYYLEKSEIIFGFVVIFSVASLARLVSAYWLNKHYVENITLEKNYYFSFWQFLKHLPHYNFNRFALYIGLIKLSVGIGGPFFAVYMWKILKFNPLWFTTINISAGIFSLIFFPLWGYFADKYGNRELLRVTSLLIILSPLLWILNSHPLYLILVPQFFAGFGWSGFNLATSNFIYDAVEPRRRAMLVAYNNLLSGIGIFFGAIIGGFIIQYVKLNFLNIFLFTFLVSGLLRILIIILFLPQVEEVRLEHHPVKKNPLNYLRDIDPVYIGFKNVTYPLKRFASLGKKVKFYRRQRITYF